MGTNYYLRCKTPRMVFDEIHIAKRSAGWKPIFQAHEGKFKSIQELRDCYLQGDYDIVDEYGDVYDWDSFNHEVIEWERRQKESNPEREIWQHVGYIPDFSDLSPRTAKIFRDNYVASHYCDPEGYEFTTSEFS